MGSCKLGPGLDARPLDVAGHQRVPQRNGRLLAPLLVAGAHLLALGIVHQG
ncbi:hypothetical protein D3C72_2388050 [compost metagenome]